MEWWINYSSGSWCKEVTYLMTKLSWFDNEIILCITQDDYIIIGFDVRIIGNSFTETILLIRGVNIDIGLNKDIGHILK